MTNKTFQGNTPYVRVEILMLEHNSVRFNTFSIVQKYFTFYFKKPILIEEKWVRNSFGGLLHMRHEEDRSIKWINPFDTSSRNTGSNFKYGFTFITENNLHKYHYGNLSGEEKRKMEIAFSIFDVEKVEVFQDRQAQNSEGVFYPFDPYDLLMNV